MPLNVISAGLTSNTDDFRKRDIKAKQKDEVRLKHQETIVPDALRFGLYLSGKKPELLKKEMS